MKRNVTFVALTSFVFAGLVSGVTSSLTFQQDIGVSFTFNPSLQVSLSSADLIIPSLTPGTSADSNVITVNIKTNAVNGYTLNATVGNDTTYNTRDLVHNNSTITNKFSSVDFGSSIAANTDLNDNTWAYNYSVDGGTTWNNYSGLPLYNDETNVATLKTTTGPVSSADGDNVEFKIAAKASSDQVSGEYNNVINFTATAQVVPTTLEMAYADAGKEKLNGYYKLQDMNANICNAAEVLDEGSQMQAIDTRDNKVYWITKLQDGKCWFTQNLDHDIVTTPGYYTHSNTDLGWGSDTATTSWTPIRATIDAVTDATTPGSITGWAVDYDTPYSLDPGQWYWKNTPFYDSALCLGLKCDYIYKRDVTFANYFSTTPYSDNGTHGHVGNYYNWPAAAASNDMSGYTTDTMADISGNPQNSICPAGWRLPTISNQGNVEGSTNEFTRLNGLYNNASTGTSEGLEVAPLYFTRSGAIGGATSSNTDLHEAGYTGYYLSSTTLDLHENYVTSFLSSYFGDTSFLRDWGVPIRCIAR